MYNADNVARVRRDEAAAKAAEEAEEQRMQEVDAQRRLAILRGEVPPPLNEADDEPVKEEARSRKPASSGPGSLQRKRKRHGEDDTDFELRLAKERNANTHHIPAPARKSSSCTTIVDSRGHISLFGDEKTRAHAQKNEEAEEETRKKRREYEDQYTMRLSNAAGKDGIKQPWYSHADAQDEPLKDIWGNDDPKRKQRDTVRLAANDPLAMMKKGSSRVRELNQERRRLQEERDRDLEEMRREDKRREKHEQRRRRRRHHHDHHRHHHHSPRERGDGDSEREQKRHGRRERSPRRSPRESKRRHES